ncbi:MAG: hypothetical protein Q8L64_06495 [bacterium]|nr:hypothetical protein [bacterium]
MDNPTLKKIGDKFGLHIDQLGVLAEEVDKVISGQSQSDDFISIIEDHLNLSAEDAIDLTTDINVEIFIPARKSVVESSQRVNSMAKEDILAEIENPTPAVHPVMTPPADDHAIAHDFIEGKLTEPVNMPTKKTTVDPYREPIQ